MARPINRSAFAAHLLGDSVTVLFLPHPTAANEFLAADVHRIQMFILLKLLDDLSLNRNSRVIGSRQPKRTKTLHTLTPCQHVHDRVLQSVAHVKRTRDVRRRNDDRIGDGVRIFIDLGRKAAALFPAFVMTFFRRLGVVCLGEFHMSLRVGFGVESFANEFLGNARNGFLSSLANGFVRQAFHQTIDDRINKLR